jgi:hypothetical protein
MTFSRSILALALFPLSVSAGRLFDLARNFTQSLPAAGEIYANVQCSDDVREVSVCNLAPFTGVFMCREMFNLFGIYSSTHSVCVPNVAQGVTLGLPNDVCGCCDGDCPKPCPCACGDPDESGIYSMQMVRPVIIGSTLGPAVCVTGGAAAHLIAWGGRVICDESCLTTAPTAAPTATSS